MIEIKIPAVGESITSGVIAAFHKKSGEYVKANEPILTLDSVPLAVPLRHKVFVHRIREGVDLLCNECEELIWRPLGCFQRATWIEEITKH